MGRLNMTCIAFEMPDEASQVSQVDPKPAQPHTQTKMTSLPREIAHTLMNSFKMHGLMNMSGCSVKEKL